MSKASAVISGGRNSGGNSNDASSDLISQLSKLDYPGDANASRQLGMMVALAGEVFVLKAQVERLTRALETAGVMDAARLGEAGESEAMQRWLAAEEKQFGRVLLKPYVEPDVAVNATNLMQET